ncbi:element excision factor XisI family protein [Trichothermofontia sp.]
MRTGRTTNRNVTEWGQLRNGENPLIRRHLDPDPSKFKGNSRPVENEIIDGKVWVQRDGTEDGVTDDLVAAGIPTSDIVLGFYEPSVRPYTGYAIA